MVYVDFPGCLTFGRRKGSTLTTFPGHVTFLFGASSLLGDHLLPKFWFLGEKCIGVREIFQILGHLSQTFAFHPGHHPYNIEGCQAGII